MFRGEITFEKIMAGYDDRRFDLEFTCQPWKELAVPGADFTLEASPQTIISSGTLDSLPLITITGVGAVSINIGSYSFTLSGIQAGIPVKVDCEAMTVTNSNQSVSYLQNMTGQFPKIAPGNNEVSWSGTVTSVVIKGSLASQDDYLQQQQLRGGWVLWPAALSSTGTSWNWCTQWPTICDIT